MCTVGEKEAKTQKRVAEFFLNALDYAYLGFWKHREHNSNVEETHLADWLKRQGHDDKIIAKVLQELEKARGLAGSKTLYDANREVYRLLRYGVKVKPEQGKHAVTVWLIDWKHPENNDFAIAEEVSVSGENTKRPDIVLYVNGIALGVLELKRSTVSVTEGIRQNLDSQKTEFIRPFFATVQLIMAGSETEGLRYGVIETKEKYWLRWKEAEALPAAGDNPLLRELGQLCRKDRLLEIVHDFMVFDAGTKKACRHNQYFGVRAAQEHVKRREGGIIWHTQGSGKSLTMVWLAKWIREHVTDSRVLLITDRTELDEQIEKVFNGVSEDIYRTKSGGDLVRVLNTADRVADLLADSQVRPRRRRPERQGDRGLPGRNQGQPAQGISRQGRDFRLRGRVPPHAVRKAPPGDEGPPAGGDARGVYRDAALEKGQAEEHRGLWAVHPYVQVRRGGPRRRSARPALRSPRHRPEHHLAGQDRPVVRDQDGRSFRPGQGAAQAALGHDAEGLERQDRLGKIVADILMDMETRDRLMSGNGNAMLVCGSIYSACRIFEMFQKTDLAGKSAIVTSYQPSPADIKGEATGEGLTEKLRQYDIYRKMLAAHFSEPEETAMYKVEQFEKEVKKRFIEEPGQMKLLIVVDKLLTGFDAPPATYLYIDKQMRDHGLFQAICRVNRLDGDDKEYGYIIDYKDFFKSLKESIEDYTGEAFDGYDEEDVAGLLKDRLEKGRERLEEVRESIHALCEPVEPPQDSAAYRRFFCAVESGDAAALKENEPQARGALQAGGGVRPGLRQSGQRDGRPLVIPTRKPRRIKAEVDHFEKVREEVKLASGDAVDMKLYEPAMRHLLDTYIRAEESETALGVRRHDARGVDRGAGRAGRRVVAQGHPGESRRRSRRPSRTTSAS